MRSFRVRLEHLEERIKAARDPRCCCGPAIDVVLFPRDLESFVATERGGQAARDHLDGLAPCPVHGHSNARRFVANFVGKRFDERLRAALAVTASN